MIEEAVILSGGLGTRLRNTVPDIPKTLAPVGESPFLKYVIDFLILNGVKHFVFSLGFKHELISQYISTQFPNLNYTIVVEKEPLGTGGAVFNSLKACKDENIFIVNGDTLFKIDLSLLSHFHLKNEAACTLSLKYMKDINRYGVVEINSSGTITGFKEKAKYHNGLINGGVYALNIPRFMQATFPEKFSFETEYLEKYIGNQKIMGMVQDAYFIDIGIPEDFEKANRELGNLT